MVQGAGIQQGSIADVIEVGCNPAYAGDTIRLSAEQLYARCGGKLSWSSPYPYADTTGSSTTVALDAAGEATVALWGGPSCVPGESVLMAAMEQAPFETVTTSFTVLPEQETSPGVSTLPSSQAANIAHDSVATIVEVGFTSAEAGAYVRIASGQLYARCLGAPHLKWIGPDETELGSSTAELTKVKLDGHGNAFVVVLGGASCAEGASLLEADLESTPYTTYATAFTINPPPHHPIAKKLDLTWEGEARLLAADETFQMALGSSFYGETEGPLKVETYPGTVTCSPTVGPWSGIGGVDLTNNEPTDTVEMNYAAGSLNGEATCTNTTGLGASAKVSLIPEQAVLSLSGAKEKAELRARSSAEPIYLGISYSGGVGCVYSATTLKGTLKLEPYALEPIWHQISLNFEKQKLKLLREYSAPECSKKATISAPFFFQSHGDFGFGEWYIIFGSLI